MLNLKRKFSVVVLSLSTNTISRTSMKMTITILLDLHPKLLLYLRVAARHRLPHHHTHLLHRHHRRSLSIRCNRNLNQSVNHKAYNCLFVLKYVYCIKTNRISTMEMSAKITLRQTKERLRDNKIHLHSLKNHRHPLLSTDVLQS